jgi:ketosteroid isomerase-like protein
MIQDMTEMKRFYTDVLLALLVGATAAPALAAEVTESELMQAATELGRQYDANYNGKNPSGMAALYTSDGMLLSPAGPIVRGREALTTYYADRFASGARGHAIKVVEVHARAMAAMGLPNSPSACRARMATSMRSKAVSSPSINATPMGGTCG